MKKIIAFMLAALMLFALCACGGETSEEPAQTAGTHEYTATLEKNYDKLCFVSGDVKFGIGDDANEIMPQLSSPIGTFESESCAYQGSDYFFYFDGFELRTNDFNKTLLITGITVSDDTVQNPQGVKIGMDIDEALELMDMDYTDNGTVYKFTEGSTVLRIRAGEDGTVAAIEYCTEANQ